MRDRERFVAEVRLASLEALAVPLGVHLHRRAIAPLGLAQWLLTAAENAARFPWADEETLTRLAWGREAAASNSALANRFRAFGLAPPGDYLDALRAATLGFWLASGLTMREAAEAAGRRPRDLSRLVARVGSGLGGLGLSPRALLAQLRQRGPLWALHHWLAPLVRATPEEAYTCPFLLRRVPAQSLAVPSAEETV